MIAATRTPFILRTNAIASWQTCCANSRVGQSTKIAGVVTARIRSLNGTNVSCSDNALSVGKSNAAVLPEPVWLDTNKSLPSSAAGIDCSCTGVGVVKPKSCSASCNDSARGKSAKVLLIEISPIIRRSNSKIFNSIHRHKGDKTASTTKQLTLLNWL